MKNCGRPGWDWPGLHHEAVARVGQRPLEDTSLALSARSPTCCRQAWPQEEMTCREPGEPATPMPPSTLMGCGDLQQLPGPCIPTATHTTPSPQGHTPHYRGMCVPQVSCTNQVFP